MYFPPSDSAITLTLFENTLSASFSSVFYQLHFHHCYHQNTIATTSVDVPIIIKYCFYFLFIGTTKHKLLDSCSLIRAPHM